MDSKNMDSKKVQLCNNMIDHICSFLIPSNYLFINKNYHKKAYIKIKKAVLFIEKWYISHKKRINQTDDVTAIKFIALFKPNTNFIIRKKLPEHIACILNLNLYSLSNLSNKVNKKSRKILEIINWLDEQKLSQYQYLHLIDYFSITNNS
jgi:hypothetical protein